MKIIRTILFIMAAGVLLVSCRQHDYRTVKVKVPQMHNQACAEVVQKALHGRAGEIEVKEINLEDRTVTVSYDSMVTALKNIEFFIADAGFQAGSIPANESARQNLPASCK